VYVRKVDGASSAVHVPYAQVAVCMCSCDRRAVPVGHLFIIQNKIKQEQTYVLLYSEQQSFDAELKLTDFLPSKEHEILSFQTSAIIYSILWKDPTT
jgi:hypothetical protein